MAIRLNNNKMSKTLIQDHLLFPEILWQRPVHMYKYQAGKVLILAGSRGMTGAAILATEAAFRSGTGILLLGFPEGIKDIYKGVLPEAMTLPLPETISGSLSIKGKDEILKQAKICDVVAIGPGISRNSETIQLVWQLFFEIEKPLVIDADGLYAISTGFDLIKSLKDKKDITNILKKRKSLTIITPHAGEALQLLKSINSQKDFKQKLTAEYIENNKKEIAQYLADKLKFIVVLKGYNTVVAEPEGRIVINKTGGPGLATAGTGDVLCGMVTSFVAQNPNKIFESITTAVYLHGLSGDIASQKIGERAMIASDVIKYLPVAIRKAEKEISNH